MVWLACSLRLRVVVTGCFGVFCSRFRLLFSPRLLSRCLNTANGNSLGATAPQGAVWYRRSQHITLATGNVGRASQTGTSFLSTGNLRAEQHSWACWRVWNHLISPELGWFSSLEEDPVPGISDTVSLAHWKSFWWEGTGQTICGHPSLFSFTRSPSPNTPAPR